MKKLSIITITLNNLGELTKTVDSVLNQLNEECEYLVIDGCSTDGTVKYLEKNKICYFSEKDHGIYDAMNKGIIKSKGEWIYFLNAGDILLPGVIEEFIEFSNDKKNIDAIYGNVILSMTYKGITYSLNQEAEKDVNQLRKGMICSHQGIFCRKESVVGAGGFDATFRIAGDWDLISRLYIDGKQFNYWNRYIAKYNQNGASTHPHIKERHKVRKKNKMYSTIDWYIVKDFLHDIKSVLLNTILGEKKKWLAIKFKGYVKEKN